MTKYRWNATVVKNGQAIGHGHGTVEADTREHAEAVVKAATSREAGGKALDITLHETGD